MLTTFSGRKPSQNEYELNSFIKLLQGRGVRRYLEVGARHGDTLHAVVSALPAGSRAVALDLPGGLWGTAKSVKSLRAAVEDLNARGYAVEMVLGDSQTEAVRDLIRSKGPFDAILLDGDHTYDGVSKDWSLYRDMAPLIAFHDVAGTGQREKVHGKEVQVPRLWAEIKGEMLVVGGKEYLMQRKVIEFIDQGSAMGIGVCVSR